MKNKKKFLVTGTLAFLILIVFGIFYFFFGQQSKTSSGKKLTKEVEVWSTHITSTVLQDPSTENASKPIKQEAELEVRMAKGETEGDQLIITPSYDVKDYRLETAELRNGEHVIATDFIKVYKHGYVYAEHTARGTDFPKAMYPDMLLPMNKAIEYNENIIKAGNNQGITVEITTTSNTVPGDYKGTFVLKVDDKTYNIPVTVTVWDIDITESHLRAVDVAKGDTMARGGEVSGTNIRNYYEDLLNYRMQITDMPFASVSSERFVEELVRYYDNPRVNTIGLPDAFGLFEQCLLEAARISTPEKIYTDKLVCYDKDRDESWNQEQVISAVKQYRQAMENVITRLENEGFFEQAGYGGKSGSFYKKLTQSIRDVKLIYTIGYNNVFEEYDITYCVERLGGSSCLLPASGPAYFGNAEFQAYREYYANSDSGEWFHYANGSGPMIGSCLPNWTSSLRYWGYAMYNMGVSGELTWATTLYAVMDSNSTVRDYPRDYYNDALSFPAIGGYMDGCYTYPGNAYGLDSFIPSIRLATRRDGFEDYELIYTLAELYKGTLKSVYGNDYDMNDVLDWVFKKAVTGLRYYHDDDTLLFEMREIIVSLIQLAKSDCEFVFAGITMDTKNANTGTLEFYVKKGYTVKCDGEVINAISTVGSKNKYMITRDANLNNAFELAISKGDECYKFNALMVRNTIEIGTNIEGDSLSSAYSSNADATALNGTKAEFKFNGTKIVDEAQVHALGKREIKLDEVYFDSELDEIYDVTMTLDISTTEADKNTDILVEIFLVTDDGKKAEIEIINAKANGTTHREVNFTFKIDEQKGDYALDYDALQFETYYYYDYSVYTTDYYTDKTGKYTEANKYHVYSDMTVGIDNVSWTKYGRAGE